MSAPFTICPAGTDSPFNNKIFTYCDSILYNQLCIILALCCLSDQRQDGEKLINILLTINSEDAIFYECAQSAWMIVPLI